jgi:dolichyl-phosphate beta-glucosyltransferase
MKRIALVVPCYNEEKRLDVENWRRARLEGRDLELVLVDDGSRDGTRALLERIARERPGTTVVRLDRNAGKGEAVRRGVNDALARAPDAVGYWDADLATPLAELPAFVDLLDARPEVDVVVGSRVKLMGRVIERNAVRHYVGRVFATAASISLALPIYDTQCGAKLFRASPRVAGVFRDPFRTRWVFDVEILARFLATGPRGPDGVARAIVELPLGTWTDVRGSKVRAGDIVRAALDLAVIARTARGRRSA